jgi:hypothetical protein
MKELNKSNPLHWLIAIKRVIQTRYFAKKFKIARADHLHGNLVWENSAREKVKFEPDPNGKFTICKQYPLTYKECFNSKP